MHLKTITIRGDEFPDGSRYPFTLEVLRRTRTLDASAPITVFVGENGSGKSTLLQAVCRQCGVHIWESRQAVRVDPNPYERALCAFVDVAWARGRVPGAHFGSDVFRHFAQMVEEWAAGDPGQLEYFGGRSLLTQSHGQSLMSFFRSRFSIPGVYFLDEPETALSPRTQLEFVDLVARSTAGQAQFVIATHSPILLALKGARIYSFDRAPISEIGYRDTDHYRVYRDFFAAEG